MDASSSNVGKSLPNPKMSRHDLPERVDIPYSRPKNREPLLRIYPKGRRIALGVAQVMVGLVFIAFGFPLKLSPQSFAAETGTPWWGGALFIISGVTSIIAERKLSIPVLRISALVNLLSACAAFGVSVLFSIDLRKWVPHMSSNRQIIPTSESIALSESQFCLRIILLIFALMEVSISSAVVTIGWRQVWKCSRTSKNEFEEELSNPERSDDLLQEPTYTTMKSLKNWRSVRLQKNA